MSVSRTPRNSSSREHQDSGKNLQATTPAAEVPNPAVPEGGPAVSRRGFLTGIGGAGVLAATGFAGGSAVVAPQRAEAAEVEASTARRRAIQAFRVRSRAARNLVDVDLPEQAVNGDDELYADRRASFFKALPHNSLGEVDAAAYDQLLAALASGASADFDAIDLAPQADRRLANPQGSFAFEMTGGDGHSCRIPAAPAFASATAAAEMGEVYWQALTRDVPFDEYSSDPLVGAAVADLNAFSATVGPKVGGAVTPETLFRGETPGDLVGPYISQFLWLPVPYGPSTIEQRYSRPVAGDDFMTSYGDWLAVQRGVNPAAGITFDGTPRYISNNRGLGEWVHSDFSYQGYLNAALIMLGLGAETLSDRNPYRVILNQGSFVTFGGPQILDLVAKASSVALKAAWYQKWLAHRRLRPEAFAARVENQQNGSKSYGLHPDVLDSDAVARLLSDNGNALLPLAFPEGSPTHPSYPAGHACVAGACCTVLKAFFKESYVFPAPVTADTDGLNLDPWTGADLTLGNEINKLAANISIGRDAAGVHYRSDGIDGITAGEQVAIAMLQDYSIAFSEAADGFELTRFDGQRILIADGQVQEL